MTGADGLPITSVASGDQVCEGMCGKRFAAGEECFGVIVDMWGSDPHGLNSLSMGGTVSDYDMSSGTIAADWRCRDCFLADDDAGCGR